MSRGRIFLIIVVVIGMLLLSYLLRGAVQEAVILPVAKLLWWVRRIYLAIPQVVFWVLLLAVLIYITIKSFSVRIAGLPGARKAGYVRIGDVQQMAFWLKRGKRGVYSKWHLANILANVALDLLQQRTGTARRGRRLQGPGWNPPADVQDYLESALKTTYADYPRAGLLSPAPRTPFDRDPEQVVAYLESFLENEHDSQHS